MTDDQFRRVLIHLQIIIVLLGLELVSEICTGR